MKKLSHGILRVVLSLSLALSGLALPQARAQFRVPSQQSGGIARQIQWTNVGNIPNQLMRPWHPGDSFSMMIVNYGASIHSVLVLIQCTTDNQATTIESGAQRPWTYLVFTVTPSAVGAPVAPTLFLQGGTVTVPATGSAYITTGSLGCAQIGISFQSSSVSTDLADITFSWNPGPGLTNGPGGPSGTSANNYAHITTATTTLIKTTPGLLHNLTINTTAAGTITITDTFNAGCTGGTVIGILAASAPVATYTYDVQLLNGLCITTGAASDVTVTWK